MKLMLLLLPLIAVRAQAVNKADAFIYPADPAQEGYILERSSPPLWAKRVPYHELESDPVLGFANRKDSTIRFTMLGADSLIWDVTYTLDAYGRRVTWSDPKVRHERLITFFGCSFVFGTGVDDADTLPEITAHLAPATTRVYNAAIGASGTNQVLALVSRPEFASEYPEKNGLFIYVPIEDHIPRANGLYPSVTWMQNTPAYELADGHWQTKGPIKDVHPWRTQLYLFLGDLFFQNRIFPDVGSSHVEYNCGLIGEIQGVLKSKFPQSRFVVVEHPLGLTPSLMDCVAAKNIPVVRANLQIRSENDIIKGEGHPSAEFNHRWAPVLFKQLQNYL